MQEEIRRGVWDELALRRKLIVLEYAKDRGSVTRACSEFEVPRSTFCEWKWVYEAHGRKGLVRKKPIPKSHPRSPSPHAVELILGLLSRDVYFHDLTGRLLLRPPPTDVRLSFASCSPQPAFRTLSRSRSR